MDEPLQWSLMTTPPIARNRNPGFVLCCCVSWKSTPQVDAIRDKATTKQTITVPSGIHPASSTRLNPSSTTCIDHEPHMSRRLHVRLLEVAVQGSFRQTWRKIPPQLKKKRKRSPPKQGQFNVQPKEKTHRGRPVFTAKGHSRMCMQSTNLNSWTHMQFESQSIGPFSTAYTIIRSETRLSFEGCTFHIVQSELLAKSDGAKILKPRNNEQVVQEAMFLLRK